MGSTRPASRRVNPSSSSRRGDAGRLTPAAERSSTVHFSLQTPEGDRGYHTAEDDAMSDGSEAEQEEPLGGSVD